MRKADMKKAIRERWRVVDDFGVEGTILGADDHPERMTVIFDRHKNADIVHYARVNRIAEQANG